MSLAQSMNLDAVMSRLSKYNPQQLQQFAATHKDDPIMLAAASSVKNKMDKLQQAYQAKASGQQPPPVNEQVVQSMDPNPQPQMPPQGMPPQGGPQGMPPQGGPQASGQLPEQQGIAQLPTPNMQQMAGGGIVAFADGGYTDQEMSDDSSPVTFMAEGGVARFQQGGDIQSKYKQESIEMGMGTRMQYSPDVKAFAAAQEETSRAGYADRERQRMLQGPYGPDVAVKTPTVPQATMPAAGYTRTDPRALASMPSAKEQLAQLETVKKQPEPDVGNRAAPPQAPPQPQGGIATIPTKDYRAQMDSYMPKETVDPFATQRGEIAAAEKTAAEKRLSGFEEDVAARGLAFKGKEERLGKREGELKKQKDLNTSMSLIEAGLATMQSRGKGLAGIAEGSTVGLKSYNNGIQRLQSAQEKIDDARDQMEELRRNEANMTAKERRGYKNDIETTVLGAKKEALAGVQQAYGVNKQDARTLFEAKIKADEGALDRASRKELAQIQADATPAQIQLINKLGGGDFAKGYEVYKQESLVPAMQVNYDKMSMDTVNGAAFLAKYPTFEVYRRSMNGPSNDGILDVPKADAGAIRQR